ncbi:DUF1552 domain-containing protein [Marinicellulosiphila megalodicopiae]|uniref:DUF1552 domain-containing protein n=1 Tax=Marinicellulosiphila megalodicopiae TaxID=2724896 RepID=UPI003BB02DD3
MKNLKTKQQVQRRNFLKASAGVATMPTSAIGLNVLSTQAMAATDSPIKRVVFVYVPFGAYPGTHLFNNDSELQEGCEPLENHKDNIIFFEGCDSNVSTYQTNGILGLRDRSKTLDVALGEAFENESLIPSIQLGVETSTTSISYNNNQVVPQQNNPVNAYNDIISATGNNLLSQDYKKIVSPLEYNLEELAKIKQTISHDSKKVQRIEDFETAIQKIKKQNQNMPGVLCSNETQNIYDWNGEISNNFTLISNMHCDTIATAFKCNITKIATLQLSNPDTSTQSTIPDFEGVGFYEMTHYGKDKYITYSRYCNERIAYLIDNLKNTTDENGQPLLDSTLVLKVTDFGNADAHDPSNAPFMMAAGNNIFDGGRNVSAKDNYELLDTITQALGLSDQIGMFGTSTVDGLFK